MHVRKWSAWSLLVLMSLTRVAQLKHVKARIHVPADPAPGWLQASRD
ncbi:hypothetical protein H5407_21385 [Mitsuaria sp. WAJ17]|nr:hypothetical protein [Mitsuaria sp. WAJ17]MBB2487798.1 hypothetical protein [Mitsuaria sp. WAJ17]